MTQSQVLSTIRHGANAAPAVAFLINLLITHDFPKATMVLVVLSVAALLLSLITERRIAPIPAFSGVMAILFGGLSLALHRQDLLQMKMSIVDGLLGATLFGGIIFKRNLLKMLLGGAMSLPDGAWRVLTIRYGLFFWACAIANEIVRRTQTAEVWATFRLVAIGAAVVFGAAQIPFLRKFWTEDAAEQAAEPPEPGF